MTVTNINDQINNILNFNGEWICDLLRLLETIKGFLRSIDEERFNTIVRSLRMQQIHGESEEDDRAEIAWAIREVRNLIAQQ